MAKTHVASCHVSVFTQLFSVQQPVQLIFHDIYLISAFFGLISIASFFNVELLAWVGKRSLLIFLWHPFIWQFFSHMGAWDVLDKQVPGGDVLIALSFLLTLTATIVVAVILEKFPLLYRSLFPRSWSDWPLAR